MTLFRAKNVATPGQVRALTAALQAARPAGAPPLIVATDQEGGQLQAIGDGATAWPGNLALAATGSATLARRCGEAIALELAAMGVTVEFAPVCDLLGAPGRSAVMGTRTFGDDPVLAGPPGRRRWSAGSRHGAWPRHSSTSPATDRRPAIRT